jgi:hypothetical protein
MEGDKKTVRAKFTCVSKTDTINGSSIILEPVRTGSQENEQFYKYTPAGKVELTTINSDAARQFIPGCDYYIDITKVQPL